MKLFFDTSSLFKLYHQEADSGLIESVLISYNVTDVFLSELTKVEFASTVWKKVRTADISELQALALLEAFEADFSKYTFVQTDNIVIEQAKKLLTKYGKQGLRTLDSIQLSTAITLRGQVGLFLSSDRLLRLFFDQEALPIK